MGKVSINNLSEYSERINTPNLPTEKEAVIAGIKRVIEHLQREVDNPASDVGKKAEMLKVMQDYKERYCPLQPSLFDFDFD